MRNHWYDRKEVLCYSTCHETSAQLARQVESTVLYAVSSSSTQSVQDSTSDMNKASSCCICRVAALGTSNINSFMMYHAGNTRFLSQSPMYPSLNPILECTALPIAKLAKI